MNSQTSAELAQILQKTFGFSQFRPGQQEAITTLLEDQRVLCIQPTGYGKSLLYQLPALLLEGITVVISPLLALMRDQISHLQDRFGIPAGAVNTDQEESHNNRVRQDAVSGRLRILFIAPEQLDNLDTWDFLMSLPVALFVVDEAHCISTWGHDFRPSYRQIIKAVHAFEQSKPGLRVLGLTATADQRVEEDIARQLQAPDGRPLKVLRSSMDRPNIALTCVTVNGIAEKLAFLAQLLPNQQGCGILYCATREHTELVAGYLSERGQNVVSYHAGYEPDRKRQLQSDFISGKAQIIAATNALGMGIDKPDIRFIVHVDVPGSITAYYQEVGRAGRDNQPARGYLLFDMADRRIQEHFIRSAQPTRADFENITAAMRPNLNGNPNQTALKVRTGLHPTRVSVILAELVEQGYVVKLRERGKQVYQCTNKPGEPDLSRYERQNQVRQKELQSMLGYGEKKVDCLMQALRAALGDNDADACGRCAICLPKQWSDQVPPSLVPSAQDWLTHRDIPIPSSGRPKMAQGLSLLNGELKTTQFINFMRNRSGGKGSQPINDLNPDLQELLKGKLTKLGQQYSFTAVIAVPSTTWAQRTTVITLLAKLLNIPAYPNLLTWNPQPESRQGTLHNNDQRKQNVKQKMSLRESLPFSGGAVLLLDDYVGSAATLKETARTLIAAGFKGEIVPFTIARIRWRLGAAGMI